MNQRQTNEAAQTTRPCGCPDCDDGVQPGHFACELPDPVMLQLEERGRVTRVYDDGRWQWVVTAR